MGRAHATPEQHARRMAKRALAGRPGRPCNEKPTALDRARAERRRLKWWEQHRPPRA